jgi:electron transfer flavoprotein beta subunit
MTVSDIKSDPEQLGLLGSPTKVKKIDNVVLQAKDAKVLTAADDGINELMKELIESHVIG